MVDKPKRLSKTTLNQKFLDALGDRVGWSSNVDDYPFLIDFKPPFPLKLRVYLFNCTNPPGGRPVDEYKFQVILPGQRPKHRQSLDLSDGRMAILAAYVNDGGEGFFVFWDADKHDEFSYSQNMQVKSDIIIGAMCSKTSQLERNNGEIVVAARTRYVYEAIRRRIEIMREELMRNV